MTVGDVRAAVWKSLLGSMVVLGITALLLSPFTSNVWSLITGRGYFIPLESSVFTFKVLVNNPGSGEWWLRGEDSSYFYGIHERESIYLVFPKAAVGDCPQFTVNDLATWCSQFTRRMPYSAGTSPKLSMQPIQAIDTRAVG